MGALNSIHDKLKEFSEVEEEQQDKELSTPQRVMRHKFLAGFDPRSPTRDIDRTPIVVEGTPNVIATKPLRSKLSSQDNGPVDPRSPSSDFTRTPLSLGHTSSDNCDTPLKAPVNLRPSANVQRDDSQILADERSPTGEQLSGDLNLSQDGSFGIDNDLDTASTTGDSLLESYDTAPLLEGTQSLCLTSIRDGQKGSYSYSSSSGQDTETDDSFSLQRKPKCRPMNRILSQNSSVPKDKGRSPLSQVENSSRGSKLPRKIVAPAIGKKSYSPISESVAVDKENVCH